ncbi:siroheme synthase [Desulfocurvibacter africanus subsp. africanus str. Walvis Bay]|uniref:precorrin-2 dehydrogenase n=2 Tax=Desulfocurvibacter africanus TaxID=873 RepID=F3Z249_DESAF|nr:siroheme synthase [Desulfocurvibacter africanus subsp. africanus str. Walvis Bay]
MGFPFVGSFAKMMPMRYYPIFIKLTGQECLVVGAGQVGRRKIASLLESGPARVLVVDTRPADEELRELLANPCVDYQTRTFRPEDVNGKTLVIASTDDEDLNWTISNLCRDKGILCNIVDQPEKCSFIVPAVHRQGDLTLAVSTGGASPALAKKIRKDLDEYFGRHYGAFLELMSRIRPLVIGRGRPTFENTALFRELVDSDLLEAMERDDREGVVEILQRILPQELESHIEELLRGLC